MHEEQLLSHEQWAAHLKYAHLKKTQASRGIRLPKQERIHFSGSRKLLKIQLCGKTPECGVLGNMQGDGSAFEAWALAFHFWCGVERIQITWDIPASDPKHSCGNPHYNRFLYRVDRFCEMFPSFATVGEANRAALAQSHTRKATRLELNSPSMRREKAKSSSCESLLEKLLADGGLPLPPAIPKLKLDRQLPVGLFLGEVAGKNAVFTAKASAIDLWGVDGDTAWIFELKAAGNCKMGIVSELLFYTNLIRDMLSPEMPSFVFGRQSALSRCRRIEACFLVQESEKGHAFHPLLEPDLNGRCLLDLLNSAQQFAGIPVCFRTAVLGQETLALVLSAGGRC